MKLSSVLRSGPGPRRLFPLLLLAIGAAGFAWLGPKAPKDQKVDLVLGARATEVDAAGEAVQRFNDVFGQFHHGWNSTCRYGGRKGAVATSERRNAEDAEERRTSGIAQAPLSTCGAIEAHPNLLFPSFLRSFVAKLPGQHPGLALCLLHC